MQSITDGQPDRHTDDRITPIADHFDKYWNNEFVCWHNLIGGEVKLRR